VIRALGDGMLLGQGRKKYVVLYPSGEHTEAMDKKTAKDYVKMFGGKVIKTSPNKQINPNRAKNPPGKLSKR